MAAILCNGWTSYRQVTEGSVCGYRLLQAASRAGADWLTGLGEAAHLWCMRPPKAHPGGPITVISHTPGLHRDRTAPTGGGYTGTGLYQLGADPPGPDCTNWGRVHREWTVPTGCN